MKIVSDMIFIWLFFAFSLYFSIVTQYKIQLNKMNQSHNHTKQIKQSPLSPNMKSKPISPNSHVKRSQAKKLEQDVIVAKNRLATLRQQLQKQKQAIKKNKQLTEQVIMKKIAVNSINSLKNKDNSSDIARVQSLKKRNMSMRLEHEKSLQNIQKAIYLVKLDDAREVKNISEQHRRKLKEMQQQTVNKKVQKKKILKQQSDRAKQRYLKYWKQKLSSIYLQQALSAQEMQRNKQEKQKQLRNLEEEEMKMLEELNMYHTKNVEAKKQYVAALSLPVKDVAEAMGLSNSTKMENQSIFGKDRHTDKYKQSKTGEYKHSMSLGQIQKSTDKNKILTRIQQNSSLPSFGPRIKIPKANNVNETKLKIILQQLKKIDKKTQRYQEQDTNNVSSPKKNKN